MHYKSRDYDEEHNDEKEGNLKKLEDSPESKKEERRKPSRPFSLSLILWVFDLIVVDTLQILYLTHRPSYLDSVYDFNLSFN